jgi:CRP-like cAMP-binding protein
MIFTQGDPAETVFFIKEGKVKLSVVSEQGKEAVIAIMNSGAFFGEGCIAGQPLRMSTATALTNCSVLAIGKRVMHRLLHNQAEFSELFVRYLLSRNIRYEADLVDQLFNSSEKRLARILLLLARFGKEGESEKIVPKVSQETLAQMVGTTRPRVNYFLNKFRKMGLIDYDHGLRVHRSLLNLVLHE